MDEDPRLESPLAWGRQGPSWTLLPQGRLTGLCCVGGDGHRAGGIVKVVRQAGSSIRYGEEEEKTKNDSRLLRG